MKFFPKWPKTFLLLFGVLGAALLAWASLPDWMQDIDVRSAVDKVIFRRISLPGGELTIRRPPAEAIPALGEMIQRQPRAEELYSLRALEEEQALDFKAAEADWKLYLQNAADKVDAELDLADFYHRRHRPLEEVNTLSLVGHTPPSVIEKFTALTEQQSWKAFERIFKVLQSQALGKAVSVEQYKGWMQRYPEEKTVYARYFEFLLAQKDFTTAQELIVAYRSRFPRDEVFLTKAQALLAYKQGAVLQGLAVYDRNFQPLWPEELLNDYFNLMAETHNARRFLQQARQRLERNPDDLNAASRVFYYYQQQGNLEAAAQSLNEYRRKKESRSVRWSAQELYTFARLLERAKRYPESARYYFALYNSAGEKAPEQALAGLSNILLEAPEQPIRFGAGDLSMYSNIATMDSGPGYLNGILSLILNDAAPQNEYAKEEKQAVAYFHRARAAELIALLDRRFPQSATRAGLHARLIETYASYGEDAAALRLGREFLNAFPQAEQRTKIGLLMADLLAAKGNTKEEFELYATLLKELAAKADGVPLGEDVAGTEEYRPVELADEYHDTPHADDESSATDDAADAANADAGDAAAKKPDEKQAFSLAQKPSEPRPGARSPEYAQVLDKYLARLSQQHDIAEALAVMRGELDRNPGDPGLYERFAQFLEQNAIGSEQEAVYRRAIQKFPGTSWYEKLARWYLRHDRQSDFDSLTQQVSEIFSGTELEQYLEDVRVPSSLSLAVEQYAHQRFPHNLVFVNDLINHYEAHQNTAEWEALIRQYWHEDASLRNRFFEYLSRTGKLDAELKQLGQDNRLNQANWNDVARANPAAVRFAAEAALWQSHYEQAAPALGAVANLYPADVEMGREASSVYRSLAWFQPANTGKAVQIELNLLKANPLNRDTLARIGDIYADHSQFIQAAPYWNRMPATEPGNAQSYEEAATVFWDYYMFDDALRLLQRGRTQLKDNTLYSYQAGAIYENRRDYPRAVAEYVKGAVKQGAQSPSYGRLIHLASRRSIAAQVDAGTAKAVRDSGFAIEAVRLRADVLRAQSRTREVAPMLQLLLPQLKSSEALEQVDTLALERGLNDVHCRILEREVALSTDPVRTMQLRYALASFYEGHKNLLLAEKNIESLYRENPRVLGVVRSTVDFYWRNKQRSRAIAVLQQAATAAYPELRNSLNFESARKMTETGEYEPARKILSGLLQQSAYDGNYLAAMADTYARAGDTAGLRDFYLKEIALFRQAPLPAEERKNRIGTLRRGLIPALTTSKDYAGAIDQYIELINAYPDDESISSETALYAQRRARVAQLINFYKKTVANSPQDPRWMIVLARLQAVTEDHQGAIQSYSQAISLRPERIDLLTSRANLEERLLRFDEAAADYEMLYQRSYHDPLWMEKEAEIRARQNRPDLSVKALEAEFVTTRPNSASAYFSIAEHLERWDLLPQARAAAEKGIAAAGGDLLATWENHSSARTYVRIMTRLRMQETAFEKLQEAVKSAGTLPPWSLEAAKKIMEGTARNEWEAGVLNQRADAARSGMASCMEEMGVAVQQYFTPEEKENLLQFVEKKNVELTREEAHDYLVPLARKAELAEFEARLIYEGLHASPEAGIRYSRYSHLGSLEDLIDLQTRRLRLTELGGQLEKLATAPGKNACWYAAARCLMRAADTYHLANRPEDELRVLEKATHWSDLGREQQQRYFELLLARSPQTLLQWSARSDQQSDESVQFLVAHGGSKLAQEAIRARSQVESPVWRAAYTGLAGLYLNDASPQIKSAFQGALTDLTIRRRLKMEDDPDRSMAGDTWFYYGSRYGEFLELARNGEAEDFLAADLEQNPATSDAYFRTALTFEQYGDWLRAVEDYHHALELAPDRVDVHTQLAGIYGQQKKREAALQELALAVAELKKLANSNLRHEASPSMRDFRQDFIETALQIKKLGAWPQFHLELAAILQDYSKSEGFFYLPRMISASLAAPHDSRAATNLVLQLSRGSNDQSYFLEFFVREDHGLKLETEPILHRLIEVLQEELNKEGSTEAEYTQSRLEEWRIKWLESLLATQQYDRLRDELHRAAQSSSTNNQEAILSLQLRLAAATGKLDSVLAGYQADAAQAPSGETLRTAAKQIEDAGDKPSARKVLEYLYRREIDEHQLNVANMLGLAEIRIESGDLPGGLELLRRMVLVAGAPFEAQAPAAALLVRTGHAEEAISFLQELVTAVPWNADYRVRLMQAKLAAKQAPTARKELIGVAQDSKAAYEVRLTAAKALAGSGRADLGSRELNLLAAGGAATATEANQHFFLAARLNDAERLSNDAASQIILLRSALEDYPAANLPRLPLMREAIKSGDYHLAVASMKQFLHSRWMDLNSSTDQYSRIASDYVDDSDDDDADTEDSLYEPDPEYAPDLGKLPVNDKAEVAEQLGLALERLGALDEALSSFDQAAKLHPAPALTRRIQAEMSEVRHTLQERRADLQRQPHIHNELDQDQVVRPRLKSPQTKVVTQGGMQ